MPELSVYGKESGRRPTGQISWWESVTDHPNQNQAAEEIFYKQLTEDSQLLALALMEDFNLPDVFWKYSREIVQELPADYGR